MSASTNSSTSSLACAERMRFSADSSLTRSSAVRRVAASSATPTSTNRLASSSLADSPARSTVLVIRASRTVGSSGDHIDGGLTKVPRPCSTRSTRLDSSDLTASRTVNLLTPVSLTSSGSGGSCEPGGKSPPAIASSTEAATRSARASYRRIIRRLLISRIIEAPHGAVQPLRGRVGAPRLPVRRGQHDRGPVPRQGRGRRPAAPGRGRPRRAGRWRRWSPTGARAPGSRVETRSSIPASRISVDHALAIRSACRVLDAAGGLPDHGTSGVAGVSMGPFYAPRDEGGKTQGPRWESSLSGVETFAPSRSFSSEETAHSPTEEQAPCRRAGDDGGAPPPLHPDYPVPAGDGGDWTEAIGWLARYSSACLATGAAAAAP